MSIPVAAQSKPYSCDHSLAGIAGSNAAGGINVSLFWVLCVVASATGRSLIQRGHIYIVCVCVCVCEIT